MLISKDPKKKQMIKETFNGVCSTSPHLRRDPRRGMKRSVADVHILSHPFPKNRHGKLLSDI
jgi:hypothetical protein